MIGAIRSDLPEYGAAAFDFYFSGPSGRSLERSSFFANAACGANLRYRNIT
jgi:hypothetical protein